MRKLAALSALAVGTFLAVARGEDRATVPQSVPLIEAYEPNVLGYTKQSDDGPFVDFTLSLKYQLLRRTLWGVLHPHDGEYDPATDRQRLYLAFTGRFGFYVRSRHSRPVLAKNYTPKLLWRYIPASAQTVAAAIRKGQKA